MPRMKAAPTSGDGGAPREESAALGVGEDWVARLGRPKPLRFAAPDPRRDLPGHVRAGSAVRRWGERLVIVQDDVNALALLDERTGVVEPLVLPAGPEGRRSFGAGRGDKLAKMDLEACVVLTDGRLVAFGSGSTPARERLVVVGGARDVRLVEGGALYDHLRGRHAFAGSELNIEGAVIVGDRLRLFQRGNGAVVDGRAPVNAVGDLDLGGFVRWLDGTGPAPSLVAVRRFDLGEVAGVPFGFTDAAALPGGHVAFLAGAEDSADTFRDGPVLGARVGLLDGERVLMSEILDERGVPTTLKLEGLDYVGVDEAGTLAFTVVADMDDPDVPAVLASLRWSRE